MTAERLQKVLATAGVASRRHAEEMISAGRVAVNGRVIRSLGSKADPNVDVIAVDGKRITVSPERHYFLLNKPRGVLSTAADPHGRPTVVDLLHGQLTDGEGRQFRIFPIGRLDLDSEGMLLLTDDGDLTHRVTHPSVELDKEYRVLVRGDFTPEKGNQLRTGIYLDGRKTAPLKMNVEPSSDPGYTWLHVTLHEGRKRQIRRMCAQIGLEVVRLFRIRIGPLTLAGLRPGQIRPLSEAEIEMMRGAVGLTGDQTAFLPEEPHVPAATPHRHRRTERRR